MTAIDVTAQLAWFPVALNTLLLLAALAIATDVWASRRRARRVSPIGAHVPTTVTAIVGNSPSVPASAGQTPSDTSLPEAA